MTLLNLFIIPGNPPALYFYELWAKEIKQEHPGCAVCLSPYPRLPLSGDASKYLNDVADMHGEKLGIFQRAVGQNVTIIGHSLGGWMALRLLEKHNAIIENCLLLYPFLRRPSLKGRTILRLLYHFRQISSMENRLLKKRGVLEKVFKDLKHVTDQELRASLILAHQEHQTISRYKGPINIEKSLRGKLHVIYCDRDTWCPSRTVNEIKQSISCEKTNTTHGFITSAEERKVVLKALNKKLFQNRL